MKTILSAAILFPVIYYALRIVLQPFNPLSNNEMEIRHLKTSSIHCIHHYPIERVDNIFQQASLTIPPASPANYQITEFSIDLD